MKDMVVVITLHDPSSATNSQIREDIRELERMTKDRKDELSKRNARCAEDSESYPDSRQVEQRQRHDPYGRTRAAVYATGNRWAIENFEATHS